MDQARAAGCEVEQDAAGNVLARKRATPGCEGAPVVALQSHVDMVCEKNEGTPTTSRATRSTSSVDGDQVRARGTTLGADDGMGVAAALAVLASTELAHGPLEALFTVDEETGLTGAQALRARLAARALPAQPRQRAGGRADHRLRRRDRHGRDAPADARAARRRGGWRCGCKVSGLKGGHSGTDIAAGRANALRLLGQLLVALDPGARAGAGQRGGREQAERHPARGVRHRSGPSLRAATRSRPTSRGSRPSGARRSARSIRASPSPSRRREDGAPMSADDAFAVAGLLAAAPHGVEAMSPELPGLVQTSTNLGIAETHGQPRRSSASSRAAPSTPRAARWWSGLARACALAGFAMELQGGYPGWRPEPRRGARQARGRASTPSASGSPMAVRALHAGLECGIIGEKYPGTGDGLLRPDPHRRPHPRRAGERAVGRRLLDAAGRGPRAARGSGGT